MVLILIKSTWSTSINIYSSFQLFMCVWRFFRSLSSSEWTSPQVLLDSIPWWNRWFVPSCASADMPWNTWYGSAGSCGTCGSDWSCSHACLDWCDVSPTQTWCSRCCHLELRLFLLILVEVLCDWTTPDRKMEVKHYR